MKIRLAIIMSLMILVFIGCSENTTEPINQAPDAPGTPVPASGAVNQLLNLELAWTSNEPDGDELTYDIYFGKTDEPELVESAVSNPVYIPSNLYPNTTYYWKIIARDSELSAEGEVWSFTTGAALIDFPLITVGAGEFKYGVTNTTMVIDYDFEIMKYEVTNAQFIIFLNAALAAGEITATSESVTGFFEGDERWAAGEYEFYNIDAVPLSYHVRKITWDGSSFSIQEDYREHPVVLVTWFGAHAFAKYYGCRLPSVHEWEKTARGNTGWNYPWGNTISGSDANYWNSADPWERGTTPVGWYNGENGTNDRPSPYGAYDVCGNVWEWTESFWSETSQSHVLKGGSWTINGTNYYLNMFTRDLLIANGSEFHVGFRCLKE